MGIASLAAIWAILLAGTIAMVIAILSAPRWLWPAPVAAALCMLILTRATQLVVVRRQEYEADRVAAKLVGSTEPLIAFLDWVSSHGGDQEAKVWDATHPSNAARRKALLGVQSSRL
jgi:Zn-dependent protease with chaperone function